MQGGQGGEAGVPPELRWLSLMLDCKMFEESEKSSNRSLLQCNQPALAMSIRDVEEVRELVRWRGRGVVGGRPVAVCLRETD